MIQCVFCLSKSLSHFYFSGHTGRILNITASPNGVFVASAGADETLRLWKCFEADQKKTRPAKKDGSSRPRIDSNNMR